MGAASTTFERVEQKYLLTAQQYHRLRRALEPETIPDAYGQYAVSSLYYDTPDFLLIRRSLEKPAYKEKLRLRCYGVPSAGTQAFAELKKKVDGVVFKRRAILRYDDALRFLAGGEPPRVRDAQITKELQYTRDFYGLAPRMAIFYDRAALTGAADPNLRITFDFDIRARTDALDLARGAWGFAVLPPMRLCLMELKTAGALPLWLCRCLSEERIYPASFSKYGRAYTMAQEEGIGGRFCA